MQGDLLLRAAKRGEKTGQRRYGALSVPRQPNDTGSREPLGQVANLPDGLVQAANRDYLQAGNRLPGSVGFRHQCDREAKLDRFLQAFLTAGRRPNLASQPDLSEDHQLRWQGGGQSAMR